MAEKGDVYRSFKIGDLIHLVMMDIRVTGRTKQLDYMNYDLKQPKKAYKQLQMIYTTQTISYWDKLKNTGYIMNWPVLMSVGQCLTNKYS